MASTSQPIVQPPQSWAPGGNPQEKRAHLYVGNLSPRVTEYMLQEIFSVAGSVLGVKIIPDRNYQHGGLNYGFVEYHEMRAAETALQTLNGRKIFDTEIRVNWAYQNTTAKEDITNHFHVFVGDLSPEVNDEILGKAFAAFGSLSDARVMWDMNSGKSRGYGFLAFRDKTDAEQAIATMNGEWLGSRAIRVNWANQKNQGIGSGASSSSLGLSGPGVSKQSTNPMPMSPSVPSTGGYALGPPQSYESTLTQAPNFNTTIYVGNLVPYTTQADLIPLFQGFGYIVEVRMQSDRGFAFIKLDTHEHAAMAIVQLNGTNVHGRPLKCSWGRDKGGEGGVQSPVGSGATASGTPATGAATYPNPATGASPYGMPTPQTSYPYSYSYGYSGAAPTGTTPSTDPSAPPTDPSAATTIPANIPASSLAGPTNQAYVSWATSQGMNPADPTVMNYYNQYAAYYAQLAAQQAAMGGAVPVQPTTGEVQQGGTDQVPGN